LDVIEATHVVLDELDDVLGESGDVDPGVGLADDVEGTAVVLWEAIQELLYRLRVVRCYLNILHDSDSLTH